jgi:hypothetical protein
MLSAVHGAKFYGEICSYLEMWQQTIKIDEANIGHKLLSKMGWKAGKGLGANESGKVLWSVLDFANSPYDAIPTTKSRNVRCLHEAVITRKRTSAIHSLRAKQTLLFLPTIRWQRNVDPGFSEFVVAGCARGSRGKSGCKIRPLWVPEWFHAYEAHT